MPLPKLKQTAERVDPPSSGRTEDLLNAALKYRAEFVCPDVTGVFSPFILRELAFCGFGGEFFDPGLEFRVPMQPCNCSSLFRQDLVKNRTDGAIKRRCFRCCCHPQIAS